MKALFSLTLIVFFLFPHLSSALELNEARSKRLVTEQADGFIKANDPSAKELETRVNGERRKAYEDIAKQNGGKLSLQQVGEQAAKKIQEKLGK